MSEKRKLVIGIAAFFLVILASLLLYQYLGKNYTPESSGRLAGTDAPDESSDQPGESPVPSPSGEPEVIKAPDFAVTDREGNTVRFSDLTGKPIVINFWASWCPPCKSEMPEFDKVYRELGESVTFLMINATDGNRETVWRAHPPIWTDRIIPFPYILIPARRPPMYMVSPLCPPPSLLTGMET